MGLQEERRSKVQAEPAIRFEVHHGRVVRCLADRPPDFRSLFRDVVDRSPSAVALVDGPYRLTYAEVQEQAGRVSGNALMRHVAARWGKEGLTANVLAPGFTVTGEMKAQMQANASEAEKWSQYFMSRTPHTRLGEPEDHAAVVALLLSDDGRWINGSIIDVNGGSLMRG
jgi:hypothetical protein